MSKWVGPCLWPTFRAAADPDAVREGPVTGYNRYTCYTAELFCGACDLFLGHVFQDGVAQGDVHPAADFRHCTLTLSLRFVPG